MVRGSVSFHLDGIRHLAGVTIWEASLEVGFDRPFRGSPSRCVRSKGTVVWSCVAYKEFTLVQYVSMGHSQKAWNNVPLFFVTVQHLSDTGQRNDTNASEFYKRSPSRLYRLNSYGLEYR